jgi:hypothetical protein
MRKASLARLLARRPDGIFVAPFEAREIGPDPFRAACDMELEGMVSKLSDRPYRAGRSKDWIKVKNRKHPAMHRKRVDRMAGSPTMQNERKHVFISHSSADAEVVKRVLNALEVHGIRCWYAARADDLAPSQEWVDAIVSALDDSEAVILIFSAAANSSKWVRRELLMATARHLPIYPVRVEDVQPTGAMEAHLIGVQWLNALDGQIEEHLGPVVQGLTDARYKAPKKPIWERVKYLGTVALTALFLALSSLAFLVKVVELYRNYERPKAASSKPDVTLHSVTLFRKQLHPSGLHLLTIGFVVDSASSDVLTCHTQVIADARIFTEGSNPPRSIFVEKGSNQLATFIGIYPPFWSPKAVFRLECDGFTTQSLPLELGDAPTE